MAEYRHPRAMEDVEGTVPAAVDLHGEHVPIDEDGTFESENETAVRALADAYDLTLADLRVGGGGSDDEPKLMAPGEFTVSELREYVSDIDDTGALGTLAELEREGKDRTTAVDAIESRIADVGG